MKEFVKIAKKNNSIFGFICLIISVLLITFGFALPPLAVIDNSVLIAVGLMFGFYVIDKIPILTQTIMETKTSLKFQKGDTSLEVKSNNNETTE